MYCPRCANQNLESARFCRSCGANLSLVPQALTGRLKENESAKIERAIDGIKKGRQPNLARGIRKSSLGLGFLTIVTVILLTHASPGFGAIWLLIPAFVLLGKGIGEIITVLSAANTQNQLTGSRSAPNTNQLSTHQDYESISPPSVTEGTTRHMDPIPERRRESS